MLQRGHYDIEFLRTPQHFELQIPVGRPRRRWAALVQLGRRWRFRDPRCWPTGNHTIRALTRVKMDRDLSPV